MSEPDQWRARSAPVPTALARCGDDSVLRWVARAAPGAGRAWTLGGAVAVRGACLAGRNRVAIAGNPDDAGQLARRLLPAADPTARIMGGAELLAAIGDRWPELVLSAEFGWMETREPVVDRAAPAEITVSWLTEVDQVEVGALIDRDFPESLARPGGAGVRRWAGARDRAGQLVAVAAEAWSAPGLGFLSGVVTRRDCRGRGYAGAVCAMALTELVAGHGAAALMVDAWNTSAIGLYRRLGLTWRAIRSAKTAVTEPATDEMK